MWHEARKQERMVRGMIVDYRKRAERRRNFYEKTKQDPTQFLQVHGRPCKIHLDPAVAMAADGPNSMMPWQGDPEVFIDRFDGRAHLDMISEVRPSPLASDLDGLPLAEADQINFERYRILVQNEFAGLSEEKFLHQLYLEEQYGSTLLQQAARRDAETDKRRLAESRAAIGYVYDDSDPPLPPPQPPPPPPPPPPPDDDDEEDDSDDDIDLDMNLEVGQLSTEQYGELNTVGRTFNLSTTGFMDLLVADQQEQESARMAKLEEEEKQALSGKKGRKERRLLKERKMQQHYRPPTVVSVPSYAAPRGSPSYAPYAGPTGEGTTAGSRSRSRSPSPPPNKVEFITSFGHDSDSDGEAAAVVAGPVSGPANLPPEQRARPAPRR
ncbi:CLK4-associating serine/arginine rich protein-like [Pollicipes pollicipes]|uniref:CLK4-associating serine/arginine rich protein-like n=1 Tax=Pollicipes pollicipes TaxID=41117 RepID=UPI00188550E4|nr:CLK4-associating serine/arginine rich protein-like [Pollicipes pollicipes]